MPRITRIATLAAASAAVVLAGCSGGGGTNADSAGINVLDLPASGPTEVSFLSPAQLAPDVACPAEATTTDGCLVVSIAAPAAGRLVSVVENLTGGVGAWSTGGGDVADDGSYNQLWSAQSDVDSPYCVAGPGPDRVACLTQVVAADGASSTLTWSIIDTESGDEVYATEGRDTQFPPTVTPTADGLYVVWMDVVGSRYAGAVWFLGPDEQAWSTDVQFELPPTATAPGYVVPYGEDVVLTETLSDGNRVTLDPETGELVDGQAGYAVADQTGSGLAVDGTTLMVGENEAEVGDLDATTAQFLPLFARDTSDVPAFVLAGTGTDPAELIVVDQNDGSQLWTAQDVTDALTVCGGTAVVSTGSAETVGFDVTTGEERWRVPGDALGADGAWCSGGDSVLLANGTLTALAAEDGATAWTADLGVPELADGTAYAIGLQPTYATSTELPLWVVGIPGSSTTPTQGGVIVVR